MEKLWPAIVHTHHGCRKSAQNLISLIMTKLTQKFDTPAMTEDTNEKAIEAAQNLWRPLDAIELNGREQRREELNQKNIQSYHNLLKKLGAFFLGESL